MVLYDKVFIPLTINLELISYFVKGESDGYTVKSKEEDFTISNYPLEQSEFFYEQKQGNVSSFVNN